MLKKFWFFLSSRRRKQFWLVLILMIFASFSEIISVGSVVPFLGIITEPDQVFHHPLAQPIIIFFEINKPVELILPITLFFIIAVIFANIVRLFLLYTLTRCSFATGSDISINIYSRTLYQEYEVHVSRNSGEVINGIITKTRILITEIISPILTIISSTIILVGIMGLLLTINFTVSISAFIIFGLLYFTITQVTKSQLKKNSERIANNSTEMVKSLQEGLGGIRHVLVDGLQNFYSQLYSNADKQFWKASGNVRIISGTPRFVIEAIALTLFAALAFFMSKQEGGMSNELPILGAFALGAHRLMPVLQALYSSYSTFLGAQASFQDIIMLLEQPLPENIDSIENVKSRKVLSFTKKIKISNVSFRYQTNTPWILKNINLSINKGERIGVIGTTGSGKSTLLDIIMGLLVPTTGELMVDNKIIQNQKRRQWQANIAHVPQNIYLSDNTIEENIAFGVSSEHINHKQVKKAAKEAQISDLIESWEYGYKTFVGERGIRLSGGQRQRIGIARALYKNANVLIFDEATNALDNETENAVVGAIENLKKDLTIIMIAHRLTTLKNCDKIIKIFEDNNITTISSKDFKN